MGACCENEKKHVVVASNLNRVVQVNAGGQGSTNRVGSMILFK